MRPKCNNEHLADIGQSLRLILYAVAVLIGLVFALVMQAGCHRPTLPPPELQCVTNRTDVVLDWTGRAADVRQNNECDFLTPRLLPMSGFDHAAFAVPGGTLADAKDAFETAVLAKARDVLSGITPFDVRIVAGEAEDHPLATKIYITMSEYRAGTIGVAGTDAGNQRVKEQVVLVLAGELLRLTELRPTADGWANAIAGTAAHEICHTLGFGHTEPRYTHEGNLELMRPIHAGWALLLPHRMTEEWDTCWGQQGPCMQQYDVRARKQTEGTQRVRPTKMTFSCGGE